MCLNFPAETIHRRVVFAETVPKKLGCVMESMAQYFVATQLLINKPLVCNNERSGHKGVDLYKTKQPEVGRIDVDEVRKYGFLDFYFYLYKTKQKQPQALGGLMWTKYEVRKYIFFNIFACTFEQNCTTPPSTTLNPS